MRPLAKGALAAVLALVLGCSLLVDTSDLDAGCPSGTKLCGGEGCVDLLDPAYGCTLDSCSPCRDVTNAVAYCEDLECRGHCLEGFGCDGCGANLLSDEANCGGCCDATEPGAVCPFRCAKGEYCKERVCVAALE